MLEQLKDQINNLYVYNRCVGEVFFNMMAIKFRDENILYPFILSSVDKDELDMMNKQAADLGFPYIQPPSHRYYLCR